MAREAAKRRRELINEISTTIDSTLTLIETILNKLELVRFDYRGLDDLKTELNLMQNLLRRVGFLRRSQSSVLFPFFERLRHFYFLIRSEERFVYEMVAEIAKFREVIEGFRLEFCEWNTSLLDAVLDTLPVGVYHDDSNEWRKLKLELKLVKMFYQWAINGRDKEGNDFFLSDIKPGIDENAKQLYYCLVKLEASGKGVNPGLAESLCLFRKSLIASCEDTKVWVRDLYSSMSNPMLMSNTYPWLCSELVGFLEYLLECLRDVMDWGEAPDPRINKSIGPLEKNLRFLKNFICFSTFWDEKLQISGSFLIHCQVSAIHAACLVYMFRFSSDDDCMLHDLLLGGSEIVEKTKLGNDQVTQKYMETLMTSIQSRPSSSVLEVQEMHVMGDFVESLADKLPELLDVRTSGMISLDNTVWMLGEGLELCRMFLKQKEKFNGLSQDEKDVLRELVYESAMVVFQMYTLEREERLAEEIRVRICQLAEKVDPFKATFVRKLSRQDTLLLEDDRVVGLDAVAEDLKNVLMTGSNPKGLGIVAIMGMAGVGKTTLAKKVYQDQVVISHFKFRAWCNVSQERSIGNMLIEILHCIAPCSSFRVSDDGELADILLKYLKRERYLVVLDNIWGSEAWNVLECCFPDQYNGSRILLTGVRNYPMINCHYTKTLGRLSDNTCLELLKQKLQCRNQGFLQYHPLWLVARLCRGLPSIVVTVGGILAESEEVEWKEIDASMRKFSHRPINEYLNFIWELGFQHLPDYLKPCLHYMAAFPVGQEICVKRLLWLWLAEGFVKQNESKDLEDTAEDYFEALIRRNFVMVIKQDSLGKAKTCRIRDSVHQFCLLKSKNGNFVQMMGEDDDFDELRYLHRLFIYSHPKDFAESRLFSPPSRSHHGTSQLCFQLCRSKGAGRSGTSQLKSLLFHCKCASHLVTAYSLSFSFRLKLLVVLDLDQINVGSVFPRQVTKLVQLRYLAILGVMNAVPKSIVSLSNLETLLLTTNKVKKFLLPDSIWYLRKLRHLHIYGSLVDLSFGENNSGSLSNLQTCSTLKLTCEFIKRHLSNFPRMRKLKLYLSSVSGRFSFAPFFIMHQLESLKLILDYRGLGSWGFHFNSSLKELTLQHFPFIMISTMEGLPHLEVLKLLQTSGHGEQVLIMDKADSKHGLKFPSLKFLKLKNSEIVEWKSHEHHLPRLQSLVLEGCHQLQELPDWLEYTPTLELIKVQNCSVSVTDLVRGIEKDQKSRGNEGLKVLYLHS